VGSAIFTMLESSVAMKVPHATVVSTHPFFGIRVSLAERQTGSTSDHVNPSLLAVFEKYPRRVNLDVFRTSCDE
jgi:hypothetical protein